MGKHLTAIKGTTTSTQAYNSSLVVASQSTALLTAKSIALNAVIGMGIGLAISLVVSGITKLVSIIDDAIHAIDRQKEKVEELKQELQTATSKLENINLELETAAKRVDELNSKDKLTFAEQGELENLKDITKELLIQQDIAEKRANQSAKELAQGASDLFNKQYGGQNFSKEQVQGYITNAKISGNNAILASDENNISALLAAYQQFIDLKNEATNTDDVKHFNGILEELRKQLWDNVSGLQEIKSNLEAVPLDERNADWVKMSEDASQGIQLIYNQLDPSKWAEINFGEIFNADTFSLVREELNALALQGKLTEDTFNDPKYKDFATALDNVGISAEQAATEINALNQTSNQTSVLSFALDDISNELTSFNDEISKLYGQFDIVNSAISEFNEYGAISAATFKSLSDNNLLQYLEFTANGLQVNTEKLLQNEQSLKDQALATLKAALGEDLLALATKGASDEAVTAQTSIAGAGNNAETAAHKFANAAIGAADLAGALAAVNAVASGQELDLSGKQNQAKALIDQYQKTADAINNIKFSTNSATNAFGGFSTAANSAASSAKKAADEMKRAMSSAQSAIQSLLSMTMNMIKQQYNDQKKNIQNQLDALSKRYNAEKTHLDNISKKKKKQYDAEKKALQDELEGYRKKVNAQLELLRAKEEERDYQNELSEKQKDVADLEADLASSSLDTSEEGIRRRLELESQLSDKRKELDEFQHDKSVEDQESALNKELSNFEDQINSKLDLLDIESQRYEEMHQERLADIDEEYERKRERLEIQQKNIEEKVSNESLIRAEAIKLIEGKSDAFYKQLLNYNRTYGDSLDATVITTWNNAYASLEKFNGGQLSVLGVLNDLAIKMNDFQLATKSAAEEMKQLADAIKYKNTVENQSKLSSNPNNSSKKSGGGRGFKIGGKITKDRALATNIDNESDAVLIKAHTDEVVLPKDNPKRALDLMAEFINSDKPLSNYVNREYSNEAISAVQFQTSTTGIGSSNLQNYERVSNYGGDTKIENVFHVQGNMDKSIIPEVERIIDRKFHENAKRQVNAITSRGGGLNAAKRGF